MSPQIKTKYKGIFPFTSVKRQVTAINNLTKHTTLHFTLDSSLFNLRSSVFSLHSLLFTLYSSLFTLHSSLFTLHSSLPIVAAAAGCYTYHRVGDLIKNCSPRLIPVNGLSTGWYFWVYFCTRLILVGYLIFDMDDWKGVIFGGSKCVRIIIS